jgi:RNA polymerase sigma-70 factor (ECF subfamily)
VLPEETMRLSLGAGEGRAQAVDIDALYRAHARTVERWARRFCGPRFDVEDVVQEVFLLAKRRLGHWEPDAKITTWLFRATEKIARRARRRQRLRELVMRALGKGASPIEPVRGPSALDRLITNDTCAEVYGILDQLPERHRRVLILFELEGLSTHEIAALIGVPLPTVRVWLFRARARFATLGRALWPGTHDGPRTGP